jgi:Leucine-rich repeat (LRR) protein
MEIEYKNYSVRIVHNPNDVILRFTEVSTMRLWQTTLTERDFVEYQVLGGLEFALSLLKAALKSELSDFKATPKELSFTVIYAPEHCKKLNIEFILPAIKKENANADMEIISKKIALLEKGLTELVPLQKELTKQKEQVAILKEDLESQKERAAGYITLPGCPFSIREDIKSISFGSVNSSDPTNSANYNIHTHLLYMLSENRYHFDSLTTLKPLKYLKQCESLRILNANIKDYSPIGEMTSLKNLHIVFSQPSTELTELEWIKKLKNLESLTLYHCKGITDISYLSSLKKFKTLDIRGSGVANTAVLGSHIAITR